MKVALVTLSGDAEVASVALARKFPGAEVLNVPRGVLDTGPMTARLQALRQMETDVFAIMTESLDWQFGKEALMLFGALAGARTSLIMDARGKSISGRRPTLLATSPPRVARCFVRGARAVRRARAVLDRLEAEVDRRVPAPTAVVHANERPVEIAYLRATPAAGTQPGGATTHINGVVNGLLALGARISFLSNDDIAGLDKDKVRFTRIGPDGDVMPRASYDIHNGMKFSFAAADAVSAARPDLIYQRYCRFSWAGVEASLRAKVPLFLEYNGSEVWIGKHWDKTERLDLLERCERLNLAAAQRIFVISEVERDNLVAAGVADEKIVVNPNGVDADRFRPGSGGSAARERLGISANKCLVGFVGTFGPWHGVLALADAIGQIPKEANVQFLLVGDGSLREEVLNRLEASGDLDRVIFAGTVAHDAVPDLLDACDILVSPHVPLADGSAFFGSPTKLFEYMAAGKGIVASRLGQIGDVLEHDETALLVEPGNVAELSRTIEMLAKDAELRLRLGAAARARAIAKHTWRANAARILAEAEDLGGPNDD